MVFEEKTISTESIYEGKILNLRRDKVTTIDGTSYREIVEHNGGAAIAALTDDYKLIMVKQYRKPAEKIMLEAPAGKRDGDETFQEVAIRELKEETGYTASEIIPLGSFYTSPGYSTEVLFICLARGLSKGETAFDEGEAIEIEEYKLSDLMDMVMNDERNDSKTELAILKTAEYLRRQGVDYNEFR